MLEVVKGTRASGRGGGDVATDVLGGLVATTNLAYGSLESEEHIVPATHVLVLLLSPNNGCLGVLGEFDHGVLEGEGRELLNTNNSDVVDLLSLTLFKEIVVDLTRTENDTANLIVGDKVGGDLWDDHLESLISALIVKSANVGSGEFMTKKGLGCHDNEGLTVLAMDLLTQSVEVVGRSGNVDDGPVGALVEILTITDDNVGIAVRELEETFKAST